MRAFFAFTKKEITFQIRSKRFMILAIIFAFLGITNPLIAKTTPWLLDLLSESLAETGMNITVTESTALDSWTQFYKNLLMGTVAFIVLESNIFTKEYSSGSLILSLTKGLDRYKVILAKSGVLVALWSILYYTCFFFTWAINLCLWDTVVNNLFFSAFCWWFFGVWLISLVVLFSVIAKSNVVVLAGVGGSFIVPYLITLLPKIDKFMPTYLSCGTVLVYELADVKSFVPSIIIALVFIVFAMVASVPIFNKKQL